MRKVLLVLVLSIMSQAGFVFAQKSDSLQHLSLPLSVTGKNELKLNLLYGVLGIAEVTYERVVGENQGVGASVAIGFDDDDTNYKFSILPYYRMYFGKKQAAGFFIEGNAGLLTYTDTYSYYYESGDGGYSRESYNNTTSFGAGVATGGKFMNKNGLFGEAFWGIGRMFKDDDGVYPRIGLLLVNVFSVKTCIFSKEVIGSTRAHSPIQALALI